MNDYTPAGRLTPESATGSVTAFTAGQLIRSVRQQKGVHLAVLSVNLKVPVRQLEALEADLHDPSKGPVFVRALASSVCRQLQMDPTPVLALLPKLSGTMPLRRDSMVPLQSASRVNLDMLGLVRGLPRQTLLVAAFMLLVIAALLWMPSPAIWPWLQPAPAAALAVEVPPAMPEASVAALPEVQATSSESATAAQSSTVVTAAPVAGLPVPVASVSTAPAMAVASVAVPTGAAFNFAATQDSWIEIRDCKNQVLWRQVLRAGESAKVQYPLPMRVVVGHAKAVNVTYQGKAFDLAPHTKVTVARFEVKE